MTESTPVVKALEQLLADSYTLYLKTQNFHWNVTGPQFFQLHTMFESHYIELAAAVDLIAERIRALGFFAPGSYAAFKTLTCIQECTTNPDASTMIANLTHDLKLIGDTSIKLMTAAEIANDEVSLDIGVQRASVHSKQVWMLKSMIPA